VVKSSKIVVKYLVNRGPFSQVLFSTDGRLAITVGRKLLVIFFFGGEEYITNWYIMTGRPVRESRKYQAKSKNKALGMAEVV